MSQVSHVRTRAPPRVPDRFRDAAYGKHLSEKFPLLILTGRTDPTLRQMARRALYSQVADKASREGAGLSC